MPQNSKGTYDALAETSQSLKEFRIATENPDKTSLLSFPDELLEKIIGLLPHMETTYEFSHTRTLYDLSCVCRRLWNVTQPILWRTLRFRSDRICRLPDRRFGLDHALRIFRINLLRHPERVSWVTSLALTVPFGFEMRYETWEHISTLLPELTALERLTIDGAGEYIDPQEDPYENRQSLESRLSIPLRCYMILFAECQHLKSLRSITMREQNIKIQDLPAILTLPNIKSLEMDCLNEFWEPFGEPWSPSSLVKLSVKSYFVPWGHQMRLVFPLLTALEELSWEIREPPYERIADPQPLVHWSIENIPQALHPCRRTLQKLELTMNLAGQHTNSDRFNLHYFVALTHLKISSRLLFCESSPESRAKIVNALPSSLQYLEIGFVTFIVGDPAIEGRSEFANAFPLDADKCDYNYEWLVEVIRSKHSLLPNLREIKVVEDTNNDNPEQYAWECPPGVRDTLTATGIKLCVLLRIFSTQVLDLDKQIKWA